MQGQSQNFRQAVGCSRGETTPRGVASTRNPRCLRVRAGWVPFEGGQEVLSSVVTGSKREVEGRMMRKKKKRPEEKEAICMRPPMLVVSNPSLCTCCRIKMKIKSAVTGPVRSVAVTFGCVARQDMRPRGTESWLCVSHAGDPRRRHQAMRTMRSEPG